MIRELIIAVSILLGTALSAAGQAPSPTILTIDITNYVEYKWDIADFTKFATDPNVHPNGPLVPFGYSTIIGDIVAVNGQPVRGLYTSRLSELGTQARITPTPGQAIADVNRIGPGDQMYEILASDSTPIGTIMAAGLFSGSAPPGAPSATTMNFAIVGGTGAFVGARGIATRGAAPPGAPAIRIASMVEDPANRRINGGGTVRNILTIFPMATPRVTAVAHSSDFTPVSASKPASANEVLSLFATGLGPLRPNADPGQPFPSNPLAVVNSPVEVIVDGKGAEVLAAVGYPGSVDAYQVNFRLPPDAAKGTVFIQVNAAWIPGPPVSIPVQ